MSDVLLYDAMRTLRAVRRLRPDPIPDAVLRRVLEAATWAPTGGNLQPWRIVVVRERESARRLGALYGERWTAYAAGHRAMIARLTGDARTRQERMLAAGDHLGAHFGEAPALLVVCFNPTLMAITDAGLERPSVVGGASVYPAVENVLLACRAEGLGCVLTTLLCEREAEIKALLAIPEPWGTAAVVPIGWPRGRGHGPISRRPVEKLVYAERFGAPFA